MGLARIALAAVVVLSDVGCGDPAGPPAVLSNHVDVEARVAPSTISLSNETDSVVVVVKVRNPLPWRVAVHLRGVEPGENIWWGVDLDPVTAAGPGRYTWFNAFSELALEPKQIVEHRIILHSHRFDGLAPGVYAVRAGLGYDVVRAGSLVISP